MYHNPLFKSVETETNHLIFLVFSIVQLVFENLAWRPVPIHTVPTNQDAVRDGGERGREGGGTEGGREGRRDKGRSEKK